MKRSMNWFSIRVLFVAGMVFSGAGLAEAVKVGVDGRWVIYQSAQVRYVEALDERLQIDLSSHPYSELLLFERVDLH